MSAAARGPLALREGVTVRALDGVGVWLDESSLPEADRRELEFYRDDPAYRPDSDLWDNLLVKAGDLRVFAGLLGRIVSSGAERVLELGAGYAWASTMLKRDHPGCEVHASDLSPEAMLSTAKWERLLGVTLDGRWAFSADRMPFADAQFDRIFAYAAFHHFVIGGRGPRVLEEALRVLAPGGRIVFLAEPAAPAWMYERRRARLSRAREVQGANIDEDVVVVARVREWARTLGARVSVEYDTNWRFRDIGALGALRNMLVLALPALGGVLPVGVHLTIERAPGDGPRPARVAVDPTFATP